MYFQVVNFTKVAYHKTLKCPQYKKLDRMKKRPEHLHWDWADRMQVSRWWYPWQRNGRHRLSQMLNVT